MRLTRKQLEQLAYDTMDEYNRKLGTYFSANTVELAFLLRKTVLQFMKKYVHGILKDIFQRNINRPIFLKILRLWL